MTMFLFISRFLRKYDIEKNKINNLTNLILRKQNVRVVRNIINPIDTGIIIKLSLFLSRAYNCTLPIRKKTREVAALTSFCRRIIASIYSK
jgi:hypothetical protein